MILSTLCYIEKEDKYLMLHRVKKEADANKDKWIGVGGKFEDGESPEECILREVKEETGLTLTKYQFRGIVTFVSDKWQTEYMHLFTATEYEGEDNFEVWNQRIKQETLYEKEKQKNNISPKKQAEDEDCECLCSGNVQITDKNCYDANQEITEKNKYVCDEGELIWVEKSQIPNLHIWEGDKVFLRLLDETKEFFSLKLRYEGETLVEVCEWHR